VGVNVYTWLDAFKAALADCEADLAFRRAPKGDADELVALLGARLDPADVSARQRRRLVATRRPVLPDQLTQLRGLEALTLETPVERRATVLFELQGSTLRFEGKTVAFPADAQEDVEFVARVEDEFTPADLPGDLDDKSRLVLVRRLVREGFLRLTEAEPSNGAAAEE
jgi:hypothetical protein